MQYREYTLTKRIAKHGQQAVLVIPKLLQAELPPGTITEVRIRVVKEASHE